MTHILQDLEWTCSKQSNNKGYECSNYAQDADAIMLRDMKPAQTAEVRTINTRDKRTLVLLNPLPDWAYHKDELLDMMHKADVILPEGMYAYSEPEREDIPEFLLALNIE